MSTKITFSVTKTRDMLPEMKAALKHLESREVAVGWPADKNKPRREGEVTNAMIGYIAEKGSPVHNIPARPVLGPGIKLAQAKIVTRLRHAGEAALEAKRDKVQQNLIAAGVEAVSGIRTRIMEGPFVPLAKRTLQARRRRGRTGDKPLQDTGQLRNSVNFTVRTKKKD